MALDRPATVRLKSAGRRNEHGEFVPGATTDHRVWATQIESTAARELEPEGSRQERIGRYRLRWFRALAEADVALSHELVVDGMTFLITSVAETDNRDQRADLSRAVRARRRGLAVEGVESVA